MIMSARPHVLVIDPDVTHQQIVSQYLSPRYHIIVTATLGEALALLKVYKPIVVLMELDQVKGDSLAWISHVRSDPSNQKLVIACVTHRREVKDKVQGFHAGADDFIVKPLNPVTFLARISLLTRIR